MKKIDVEFNNLFVYFLLISCIDVLIGIIIIGLRVKEVFRIFYIGLELVSYIFFNFLYWNVFYYFIYLYLRLKRKVINSIV